MRPPSRRNVARQSRSLSTSNHTTAWSRGSRAARREHVPDPSRPCRRRRRPSCLGDPDRLRPEGREPRVRGVEDLRTSASLRTPAARRPSCSRPSRARRRTLARVVALERRCRAAPARRSALVTNPADVRWPRRARRRRAGAARRAGRPPASCRWSRRPTGTRCRSSRASGASTPSSRAPRDRAPSAGRNRRRRRRAMRWSRNAGWSAEPDATAPTSAAGGAPLRADRCDPLEVELRRPPCPSADTRARSRCAARASARACRSPRGRPPGRRRVDAEQQAAIVARDGRSAEAGAWLAGAGLGRAGARFAECGALTRIGGDREAPDAASRGGRGPAAWCGASCRRRPRTP